MLNKSYNEALVSHLKGLLESLDDSLTYIIGWYIDVEKRKLSGQDIHISDNEVFITLTPLPSRSFGDGNIQKQIELTCMCAQSKLIKVMDVLAQYQDGTFANSWYIEDGEAAGTLVTESWYCPTINESSVEFGVTDGCTLSMTGVVTFTPDVLDYTLYINNQKIRLLECNENLIFDTVTNNTINDINKEAINRSMLQTINIKCINTNNNFCTTIRDIKRGLLSINTSFAVKIVYNDGVEISQNMVINSGTIFKSDGTVPTISVSLQKKKNHSRER